MADRGPFARGVSERSVICHLLSAISFRARSSPRESSPMHPNSVRDDSNGRGTAQRNKNSTHPGERIKPSPETFEPKALCNICAFCLIQQSFVKKLVDPARPPFQVSASAYSPRLMSEPEP